MPDTRSDPHQVETALARVDAPIPHASKEKIDELKQSLLEYDVALKVRLNEKMHDREVRFDNGWTIKIGRGLDFYQKPEGWYAVGATDLSLRRCLETKVDVFRAP